FPGKGVKCSRTNRAIEVPEGIGFHKGVRILHPLEDTAIIESVLKEARNADYPPECQTKFWKSFDAEWQEKQVQTSTSFPEGVAAGERRIHVRIYFSLRCSEQFAGLRSQIRKLPQKYRQKH
ncbi:MAG: hypothetical protein MK404_07535, partial [SAR324 cluster bacterium]|nr:hypothetical protein [SAR324 cluster bacterium]